MIDPSKLSLDDFRKWMRENADDAPSKMQRKSAVGTSVESKVGSKRLVEVISTEDGNDGYELAVEFRHNGGTVMAVEGKRFFIEVDGGSFWIPRHFVRKV